MVLCQETILVYYWEGWVNKLEECIDENIGYMFWREYECIFWYLSRGFRGSGVLVDAGNVWIIAGIMIDMMVQCSLTGEKVQVGKLVTDVGQSSPNGTVLKILAEKPNKMLFRKLLI